MNVQELLAQRATAKEKKLQTVTGIDKTGQFFRIKSSTGKEYWWSIQQFEKDLDEGTKVMVNENQFQTNGTDFSKLELA